MVVLIVVLSLIFILLFVLSIKEDSKNIIERMSLYIHRKIREKNYLYIGEFRVRKSFAMLFKPKQVDSKVDAYYRDKISKVLKFMLITLVMAIMVVAITNLNGQLKDNRIKRADYGGETDSVTIVGEIKDDEVAVCLDIYPREYSDTELNSLYDEFRSKCKELILGENTSLENVSRNLELTEEYEGYPFLVSWYSDRSDLVSSSGVLGDIEEKCEVTLTANLSYSNREFEKEFDLKITLCPVDTKENQTKEGLKRALIKAESESREEEDFVLPQLVDGDAVRWKLNPDKTVYLLPLLLLGLSFGVFFIEDGDLKKRVLKKQKRLKTQYPDVVYKLLLYINAGLSVRRAFFKLAAENSPDHINKNIKEMTKKLAFKEKGEVSIYDEIEYMCREVENGCPEAEAYEKMGKRTGCKEYIRLGVLLSQNLKKGNRQLEERLYLEVDRAYNDEILHFKSIGGEAETKLLFPMVLMLFVVVLIVMLPAFWTMGGQ